jgi:hypothetical protein
MLDEWNISLFSLPGVGCSHVLGVRFQETLPARAQKFGLTPGTRFSVIT